MTNRLVCIGRLSEQKGQLLLIEAVKSLVGELNFQVVLVGDGELRPAIEQLIVQHGLQSTVSITGWLSNEEVFHELSKARALLLPSFAEGLPIVIMEAMAMRRPVISTFVGGIPELVISGEHGWLVPAGDVAALAGAIRNCLGADMDVLTSMGEAAYTRVLEHHDIIKCTAQLASLFESHDAGKII